MISTIATCLSYISNDYLLMLVAVLFYIFSKRTEYAHLIILLLFAMIYKAILKDLLKIPAPVTSPTKYGFPSGHINFATMFFGWFMITHKSKLLYFLCPAALALASLSTIYLGYHDISDVLLTPILPVCFLTTYYVFLRNVEQDKFMIIFITISFAFQVLSFTLLGRLPIDVAIGSYGILGFCVATSLIQRRYYQIALCLCALFIYFLIAGNFSKFLNYCVWFGVFGVFPIIKQITTKCERWHSHW